MYALNCNLLHYTHIPEHDISFPLSSVCGTVSSECCACASSCVAVVVPSMLLLYVAPSLSRITATPSSTLNAIFAWSATVHDYCDNR